MGFKRCAFVIFVITMFSLLAVQSAFSLESDFVSTGNSTVGVLTTTSYADLLNGNINNNSQGLKFGNVLSNKVILHQSEGSSDILTDYGDFNIKFKVPKGHRFTFNIVISGGGFPNTHSYITIKDGVGENTFESGIGDYSFFWKKENNGSIYHDVKPPVNIEEWFYTESDDYTINIEGHRGIKLEFYIIFNDSTA